jgi:hypothetical protein
VIVDQPIGWATLGYAPVWHHVALLVGRNIAAARGDVTARH